MLCVRCGKAIRSSGVIRCGKAYHPQCWTEEQESVMGAEMDFLCSTFPGIAGDTLDELQQSLFAGGEMGRLVDLLKSPWCVITEGLNGGDGDDTDADTFRTKKDMLEWIADNLRTGMIEGYVWNIIYILQKGDVVVDGNGINIKVSI